MISPNGETRKKKEMEQLKKDWNFGSVRKIS
jgi:hypothetical protein